MREHTGAALGIGVVATLFLTILAPVLVVLTWTALTVYALVKWIGSAPEAASPTTVLLIVVALVTVLVTALAGAIALVGRGMTPPSRRRRERRAAAGDATSPELSEP